MEPEDTNQLLSVAQQSQLDQHEPTPIAFEEGKPETAQTSVGPAGVQVESRFDSNYRYVLVAARRARQLQSGVTPLVATQSGKACRIAQEEIAAGRVSYVRQPAAESFAPRNRGSLVNTYSA